MANGKARRSLLREKVRSAIEADIVKATVDDSSKVDFRIQGNLELYEDAMLMKREKLKHHPSIVDVMDRWWDNLILTKFDLNKDETQFSSINCA